jgi:hypothetical protein
MSKVGENTRRYVGEFGAHAAREQTEREEKSLPIFIALWTRLLTRLLRWWLRLHAANICGSRLDAATIRMSLDLLPTRFDRWTKVRQALAERGVPPVLLNYLPSSDDDNESEG